MTQSWSRRSVLYAMGGIVLNAQAARASGPGSFVRVHGKIAGGSRTLDMAGLDALPRSQFATTTPWHPASVEFSGVLVRDFLAAMGAHGDRLIVTALNDYLAEIDISLLVENDALLATRQNGELMPISDKGPVFLVFPFDSRTALQHQVFYSRSVWQICDIEVQ